MIKFTPKTVEVKSIMLDKEAFVNNSKNISLAAQLENRFKSVFCKEHPTEYSIILFDYGTKMFIKHYCCNTFKETLDQITNEQYPLPPK